MPDVTCGECRKKAEIGAPADVWKCPDCGALTEDRGAEDNSNDPVERETAELEARLLELRGGVASKGNVDG